MRTFFVSTLGCRTNQYESQAYIDQLLAQGYVQVQEGQEADLCIVNTCTVTDAADHSSRHAVAQITRKYPHTQVIVTGCAAEKNHQLFTQMPGVVHVVPNKDKERLLPLVFPEQEWPEFSITSFAAHTRAFVKVQDGCNSFCSYCIIPYVRGRSRSRRVEEILAEVRALVRSGFREIVLTGINIGDFDGAPQAGEKPVRLADLVRAVDAVEGVERLRISSIDPDEVDKALMAAILQGRSTCPSLHIVLQSGSNTILKRMNRKYTAQMFMQAVERLRFARSDFTFTTDIIVGFPGETECDFQDTMRMVEGVQFAKVHMFPYSKRERTRAALFPDAIAADVITQRKHLLLTAAEQASHALRERYIGKKVTVLIENKEGEDAFGHTEHFLPFFFPQISLPANTLVSAIVESNTEKGLQGRMV